MPILIFRRPQNHFSMRYAVFQVFGANRLKAEAFVKLQEVGLCSDFDRQVAKQTTAHFYTSLHEQFPCPGTPGIGRRNDPADRNISLVGKPLRQQTGITKQFPPFIPPHQVPAVLVFSIGIEVRTILFHYEYLLP